MRSHQRRRQGDSDAGVGALDIRVRNAIGVAIGIAEVRAFLALGQAVQLIIRPFIVLPISGA